ncbi:MAG: serine kinase [Paracoccaceae bacterium]
MPPGGDSTILHAGCVAVDGRGLLIMGPSGAGKSGLALRLMALGATLVSDDRTEVFTGPQGVMVRCPSGAIRGLIEARGMGILRAPTTDNVPVALVVDLSRTEDERLPPPRVVTILGSRLPLVLRVQSDHFVAALMVRLRGGGRQDIE